MLAHTKFRVFRRGLYRAPFFARNYLVVKRAVRSVARACLLDRSSMVE